MAKQYELVKNPGKDEVSICTNMNMLYLVELKNKVEKENPNDKFKVRPFKKKKEKINYINDGLPF